ncbi:MULTISPECIES: helix-turn-helix domain-containing protein [unclassified Hwanghaeella]|uniref:helix-turn-helix domain-containing protein n=1 Tax=unclassified Hwanghaeella TaxID=2605944 RepID=UPI003B67AF56|tara:strand:- start:8 stop:523 length:516 start_codon:yes stop_codon:yes gene_type:complete
MSIQSKFKAQFEPAARIPDEGRNHSHLTVSFLMKMVGGSQLVSVARLLIQKGATPKSAKQTIDKLATGADATIDLQTTRQDAVLVCRELKELGIDANVFESVPEKDVIAIRSRLNLTRADFSRRFGIDERTLESWEQHRSSPNKTARTLLHVIDREPDLVTAALLATDPLK